MKRTGLIILSALLAGFADAAVIYQDDFSGSSEETLNGAAPDVRPGSEVWLSAERGQIRDLKADGSFTGYGTAYGSAALPFTVETGKVYTFTADLVMGDIDSTNSNWAAITFCTDADELDLDPRDASFVDLFVKRDGTARAGCIATGWTKTSAAGLYGGTVGLSIILNTTGENWSAEYKLNNITFASTSLPAVTNSGATLYLKIGHYRAFGEAAFDNLSLQERVISADTIYEDDFSGSSEDYLNGMAPDIRPDSEVWLSAERGEIRDLKADGSFTGYSTAYGSAALPFTVEDGRVYTFTIDLAAGDIDPANTAWAAITFCTDADELDKDPRDASFADLFVKRDGTARAGCLATGWSKTSASGLYGGTVNLSLVLDTTSTDWTVEYRINGSYYVDTTLPAVTNSGSTLYIKIGHYRAFGEAAFDNLSLTGTHPDPYSSWLGNYPGIGTATNKVDDPDSDGLNNLAEWALGGNPGNTADKGHATIVKTLATGGTNWLEYVYAKRSNAEDLGLTYWVEQSIGLLSPSWTNENIEVVGEGTLDSEFNAVTNRISTETESMQFLRLRVESN